jgi:hypothetical protein
LRSAPDARNVEFEYKGTKYEMDSEEIGINEVAQTPPPVMSGEEEEVDEGF